MKSGKLTHQVEVTLIEMYRDLQGLSTIPGGCLGFLNHQH